MRTLSVGRHERNNSIIAVEQLWFHRSQINYSTIINILRNPTRGRWFTTMSLGEILTATVKDKKFWVDFKSKLLACKSNNNYYYIALGKQSKNKQVKKACKWVQGSVSFALLCFLITVIVSIFPFGGLIPKLICITHSGKKLLLIIISPNIRPNQRNVPIPLDLIIVLFYN